MSCRAPFLLLVLVLGAGTAVPARAQPCVPATPDGTSCDDDLDPCTDDRCDDGACEHATVGFVEACRPILTPFQRVLVLAPFATRLTVRIAAVPVGDPPAFTLGQRNALVNDLEAFGAQLERVRRTLGGQIATAGDTAQSRAVAALSDAEEALRLAVLVRDLVRAATRVDQFDPATAAELTRSTTDLVRGAKAVKRDLSRLRKVSQVFRP